MSWLVNLVLDAANPQLETHNTLFIYCCHGEKFASTPVASPTFLCKAQKLYFSPSVNRGTQASIWPSDVFCFNFCCTRVNPDCLINLSFVYKKRRANTRHSSTTRKNITDFVDMKNLHVLQLLFATIFEQDTCWHFRMMHLSGLIYSHWTGLADFKAVSLLRDFSKKDCVILRHNNRPSLRYLTSYRNWTWTCPIRVPFNHSV